jgi:hypothetical protein
MRKAKAKTKLVLRQEQIQILGTQELQRAAGGFDSEPGNGCPLVHPGAAPSQADATCGCG